MRRIRIAMVVSALALTACSGAELTEQIIETDEGDASIVISEDDGTVEMEIETDEGDASIVISEDDGTVEMEIETEDGDASIVIGGGDVPAGFPIPVPDGGTVTSVLEQGAMTSVTFTFPGSDFESIKAFYEDWISSGGIEELDKFEASNPPTAVWTLRKDQAGYTINLTQAGNETLVSLLASGG